MLPRCARLMLMAPVGLAAGMLLATGLAVGTGLAGAALLAKRMREERKGWRDAADDAPPAEPIPDAPPL
jgi:hypothetical protein